MKKLFSFIKSLNINYPIVLYVVILCTCSLITLKYINPLLPYPTNLINFYSKQVSSIIISIFVAIFVFLADFNHSKKFINIVYWVLVVMLVILATNPPVIGNLFVVNTNGANGWFMFFTKKLSFQPVEFFKIVLILKLAEISKSHLRSSENDLQLFKKYSIYGGFPILMVLLEPDAGGVLLIGFASLVMFLCSFKDKKKLSVYLAIGSIIAVLFGLLTLTPMGQEFLIKWTPLQAYQLKRIDAWLEPFTTDIGYQLQQSLIFMGSAGPFGHGAGFDQIAYPEAQTDLIFTTFVGFFGWVPGLLLILVYFLLIYQTLSIGELTRDDEQKFIIIGYSALIFIQVLENIGMMIGILPLTGVVLPFMSYGSSAMLTFFVIVAIILNISRNTKR